MGACIILHRHAASHRGRRVHTIRFDIHQFIYFQRVIIINLQTGFDEWEEPTIFPISGQDRNQTLFEFCPTAAETEEAVVPESSYIRLRHNSSRRWVRATKIPIDVNKKNPAMMKVRS